MLKFSKSLFNTNRNITADNWFSSIELCQLLKMNGFTTVEEKLAIYGFARHLKLVFYAERRGHTANFFLQNEKPQKPAIVAHYNTTKGGELVDVQHNGGL
ncbi:hypothetical protein Trydic_g3814 [Trypoxylus dichotomus]